MADYLHYAIAPTASLIEGIKLETPSIRLPAPDSRGAGSQTVYSAVVRGVREAIMQSRSRVAVLTTGGLDSAVIAALAAREAPTEPLMVAMRGGLTTPTEDALQEELANYLGIRLIVVNRVPHFDLKPLLIRNRDSSVPTGGVFTHIWDFLIDVVESLGADVLLTGEGGNEVFSPSGLLAHDLFMAGHIKNALSVIGRDRTANETWRGLVRRNIVSQPIQSTSPDDLASRVMVDEWWGRYAEHRDDSRRRQVARARALHSQGHSWSTTRTLLALDRIELGAAGAANSRVIQVAPLADTRVVAAVAEVPVILRNPVRVGLQDKHLLRLIARQLLPASISEMRKIGRSDQAAAIFGRDDYVDIDLIRPGAEWLGLNLDSRFQRPHRLPAETALAWTRTLTVSAWATANIWRDRL